MKRVYRHWNPYLIWDFLKAKTELIRNGMKGNIQILDFITIFLLKLVKKS
jgi:hypothetical protein